MYNLKLHTNFILITFIQKSFNYILTMNVVNLVRFIYQYKYTSLLIQVNEKLFQRVIYER